MRHRERENGSPTGQREKMGPQQDRERERAIHSYRTERERYTPTGQRERDTSVREREKEREGHSYRTERKRDTSTGLIERETFLQDSEEREIERANPSNEIVRDREKGRGEMLHYLYIYISYFSTTRVQHASSVLHQTGVQSHRGRLQEHQGLIF